MLGWVDEIVTQGAGEAARRLKGSEHGELGAFLGDSA